MPIARSIIMTLWPRVARKAGHVFFSKRKVEMADNGATFSFGFQFNDSSNQSGGPFSTAAPDHPSDAQGEQDDACEYNAPAQELYMGSSPSSNEGLQESVEISPGFSMLKKRVTGQEAAGHLHDDRVASNDLIPGVYEGGFKLWEGAIDLSRHLIAKYGNPNPGEAAAAPGGGVFTPPSSAAPGGGVFTPGVAAPGGGVFTPPSSALEGKKVLELGCGHGLPGILCLLLGAEVHFQDYNHEVLTQLTMPNVAANFAMHSQPGRSRPRTRFFSGDWGSVGDMLSMMGMGGEYDLILTSESIYNEESSERLLETIKRVLRPPHGLAMVASKSYYFGVGGGTKAFRGLVKRDGIFEVSDEGSRVIEGQVESGNKREVIEMKFPDSIAPYFL